MRATRITLAAVVSAAGVAFALAACGALPQSQPQSGAAAGVAADATAGGLDDYNPTAEAFYRRFAREGLLPSEYFDGLADAVPGATAVVVGKVVAVKKTRDFQGEIADDRFTYVGVVIEPVEVLAGSVPNQVTVEFDGPSDPSRLERLEASLPVGHQAVWFLRDKVAPRPNKPLFKPDPRDTGYWRLVTPDALFAQGTDGVATPLAEALPGEKGLAADGRRYQTMSALVSAIRDIA